MTITTLLLSFLVLSGCASAGVRSYDATLEDARDLLDEGQLYRAKKSTESVLANDPYNIEAQALMAEILDREIARQKDMFEESVPEDWSQKDKQEEVRTWIERSETYLRLKEFNQAITAAENVFVLDPQNAEASRLIDTIRKEAYQSRKKGVAVQSDELQTELDARIKRYRARAEKSFQDKRYGEARLVTNKILLLAPEDPVGLKINHELKTLKEENGL